MVQTNDIDVGVVASDGSLHEFKNVHYVSFINFETFGIPAILSDESYKRQGLPMRVLYVNPQNVAAVEAVRNA